MKLYFFPKKKNLESPALPNKLQSNARSRLKFSNLIGWKSQLTHSLRETARFQVSFKIILLNMLILYYCLKIKGLRIKERFI